MRAIGYVDRYRAFDSRVSFASESTDEWPPSLDPSAGSWGHLSGIVHQVSEQSTNVVEQIIRYCHAGGHHLVAVLGTDDNPREDDGSNAVTRQRYDGSAEFGDRQFARLMELIEGRRGRPALVVVPDSSHLATDLETLVQRLLLVRRSGSDVICTDPELPDPLQNGEELLGMRGDADWFRKQIRSRIREKAARGQVLGRTPYGYRSGADGTLKPVPEEAEVVKQVFQWYVGEGVDADAESAAESDGRKLGMRLIAQRLTDARIPTRTGKPWSTATISIILKNRVYTGTYTRYGFLVAGNHEPIIKRSLFRKAQNELFRKQRRRRLSETQAPFLLGGVLKCAHCGHGVPGLTRRRRWRRRDESLAVKTYRYYEFYECQYRRGNRNGEENPKCPRWRADELDGQVRRAIGGLDASVVESIVPAIAKISLEQQLEEAEKTFLNGVRLVSSSKGDIEDLEPLLDKLKRVRKAHEEEQAEPSADGTGRDGKRTRVSMVKDLIADIVGSDDVMKAREALSALVDEVRVTDDEVSVHPRFVN